MSEDHTSDDRQSLSRRGVLRGGALAGAAGAAAAMGALGGGAAASAHEQYRDGALRADLLLYNGRIHTMDARNRIASVLAIQDGKIIYVGNDMGPARRAIEGNPRTVNLRGRTAIPGLIDCHNHVVLMGNRPGYHTPLENAYSVADVQNIYRDRAEHAPAGKFITTIGGFHFNQFKEVRLPTLTELDAALPNHAAYISVGFTGPSVTNTLGKKFFEAASLPVTVGADGSIAGGTETGKATLALRRALTDDDRRRSTLDAMAYAVSLGVTTHLDQGAFQKTDAPSDGAAHEDNYTMNLPFLKVYDEGKGIIRLRINFLHQDTDTNVTTLTQRIQNAFQFFGNDMVRTGSIGEFIAARYFGGPVFLEAAR
jgi:predicted amidohydrolase YtcJ